MSHELGLENAYEKLVLLEHFAQGSRSYCALRKAGSQEDIGDEALDAYWRWVKGIVGAYLIECSVRLRLLLDTAKGEDAATLSDLDDSARNGLFVATIVKGSFDLTLRESCNKIIHATRVVPEWATATDCGTEYKYWSGDYRLVGMKREEPWELVLHVAVWARAMARFLDEAETKQLFFYVGQDWY